MGGRKSYNLSEVVGSGPETRRARQRLIESVKSREPRQIVGRALDLVSGSDQLIHRLAEAVQAFQYVKANADAPPLELEARKRLAAKFWAETKKREGAQQDRALDTILVDSIARVIRRRKRK